MKQEGAEEVEIVVPPREEEYTSEESEEEDISGLDRSRSVGGSAMRIKEK